MSWWLWAFLGIFLLGSEMLTPGGFYMLFFGIGALLVGALVGLDVIQSAWMSWLLFSGLSVGSLLVLRPRSGDSWPPTGAGSRRSIRWAGKRPSS